MQTETNGRDTTGRFTKGNTASRGPRNTYVRRTRAVFEQVVDEDALRRVLTTVLKQAEAGCLPSQKLLCEYGMGKPTQRIEIDHPTPLFDAATERAAYECVPAIDAGTDDHSGLDVPDAPPAGGECDTSASPE